MDMDIFLNRDSWDMNKDKRILQGDMRKPEEWLSQN